MSRFKGIGWLIILFLFLLASALLCPSWHHAKVAPSQTQQTATSTTNVDTSDWPTYTDSETGISFKYPTFGQQARVVKETEGSEGAFAFFVQFFDQDRKEWGGKYDVFFGLNQEHEPLLSWFAKVVDLGGYIMAQHAYELKTLPNGIQVLVLGKIPPEHDGNVPDMYATSPNLDYTLAVQTTEEGGVGAFTSHEELEASYLQLLSSMQFSATDHNWQQATLEGFGISYPSSWIMHNVTDGLTFSNVTTPSELSDESLQNESFFKVAVEKNRNQSALTVHEWFTGYVEPLVADVLISESDTTVSGYPAIKIVLAEVGGKTTHIYVARSTDIIEISYGLFAQKFVDTYSAMVQSIKISNTQ
jgi:hypothetical protein